MTDWLTDPWRIAWWATYAPIHAPRYDRHDPGDLDRWLHDEPSMRDVLA